MVAPMKQTATHLTSDEFAPIFTPSPEGKRRIARRV